MTAYLTGIVKKQAVFDENPKNIKKISHADLRRLLEETEAVIEQHDTSTECTARPFLIKT